jgi:hypothetical protein
VPQLARLSVAETAVAMQDWARRAHAVVGDDPAPLPAERSLHLSRILDGRRELSGSFDPEGGAVIATALRLAATGDVDGEPRRSPAQRRGDALVDVCRWYLDHQQHRRDGRHRPHLNIIATLHDLEHRGQGRLLDGTILDPATVQRLVCDAGIHRVITHGRSSILDYGTTTRTVPANLFNALVIRDRHCRFPGCDRPPNGPKPTTSAGSSTAGPPASTTSPCNAPATTTCSTPPAGTPNSSPTTASSSPRPTAEHSRVGLPVGHHPDHPGNEARGHPAIQAPTFRQASQPSNTRPSGHYVRVASSAAIDRETCV